MGDNIVEMTIQEFMDKLGLMESTPVSVEFTDDGRAVITMREAAEGP